MYSSLSILFVADFSIYRKERSLSLLDHKRLELYPFNTQDISPGLTDDEYREKFGEEAYKVLLLERIKQKERVGQRLLRQEEAFLKNHPTFGSQL